MGQFKRLSTNVAAALRSRAVTSMAATRSASFSRVTPAQASLDQNSVDVQAERARFADNAMRYQATMRFLDSRFSGLVRAFRGD